MIRSPHRLVTSAAVALTLPFALAACARDDAVYPSLAARPIEKLGFAEPTVPVVAAKADPALDTRIAEIGESLAKVAKGAADDAAKADAAARTAKGKPVGSDAWLNAQSALAGLDDWRAQASALVTTIDGLALERAAVLAPDYPALGALKDAAQAEVDRQTATIARLQDSLPAA